MTLQFKDYIKENKSIFDYLLFPPKGEELKIATKISKMKSNQNYVYRGMSKAEWNALKRDGKVVSKGVGNTRNIVGSYVGSDVQLAGRFALRAWKDGLGGVLITLDRKKLPKLNNADPGNYYTDFIPLDAVVDYLII